MSSDPLGSPLARAAFEAAAEGLLVLEPDGLVVAMNAAFGTLYGIDPPGYVGCHYSQFAKGIEVRRFDVTVDEESWVTLRALRGERVQGVIQSIHDRKSGREFVARCGASPFFQEGRLAATTITVEDVTQTTRAQQSVQGALSAAEVATYRIDLVKGLVWGDDNFSRVYGLPERDAQGGPRSNLYKQVHADDLERVSRAFEEATRTGEPHEIEYRVVGPGGEVRWLLSRGRAELDANGLAVQRLGSVMDVTRQKRAEEALRQSGETFESLVRNSPLGTYAVDADFRLALVSQGAQRVFENVRPLIGRDFAEVLRTVWEEPFASEAIALFRRTLETGEPYHAPRMVETRHDLGKTESYDWKIERAALPDGHLGVVCHFYDLSERQRQEAELQRRIDESTQELRRANQDLDQFASSVAHDLRSPLRGIVLTSRLLTESAGERLTEEERTMLERQAKGAIRLSGIVDDMLKFARLAHAEFRSAPLDLTRVIERAAREVADRGWASPPVVVVQEGMRAQGDPNLLGYALTNLLDNACKFSPEGGTVTVGEEDGAYFVRDEGVGFDMRYAGKLFAPFERLVDQRTFQGTGLGLANVRRIVERHGGRVWAESAPGAGATFRFTLAPDVPA